MDTVLQYCTLHVHRGLPHLPLRSSVLHGLARVHLVVSHVVALHREVLMREKRSCQASRKRGKRPLCTVQTFLPAVSAIDFATERIEFGILGLKVSQSGTVNADWLKLWAGRRLWSIRRRGTSLKRCKKHKRRGRKTLQFHGKTSQNGKQFVQSLSKAKQYEIGKLQKLNSSKLRLDPSSTLRNHWRHCRHLQREECHVEHEQIWASYIKRPKHPKHVKTTWLFSVEGMTSERAAQCMDWERTFQFTILLLQDSQQPVNWC